jgi:hypothetical protein
MTVTSRRKPATSGDLEQLRAELAELRAENTELRAAVKAVAALAVGIGYHSPRISTVPVRTVADACRVNGVHGDHADTISQLLSP